MMLHSSITSRGSSMTFRFSPIIQAQHDRLRHLGQRLGNRGDSGPKQLQ